MGLGAVRELGRELVPPVVDIHQALGDDLDGLAHQRELGLDLVELVIERGEAGEVGGGDARPVAIRRLVVDDLGDGRVEALLLAPHAERSRAAAGRPGPV
ncbi:hypothetical protein [Sorangium sp. So ce388]|uniref:hypothetical protein n=1 Tax=Sorangium sp. So ce388 TaxID=3133309 RepID=UPI003F5B804E